MRATVAEQSLQIATMKQNFDTYKANSSNLDVLSEAKSQTQANQNQVRGRINNVPVGKSDQPFTDPNLLSRARILREYQQSRTAAR